MNLQKFLSRLKVARFNRFVIILCLIMMLTLGLLLNYHAQKDVRLCFMDQKSFVTFDRAVNLVDSNNDGGGSGVPQLLEDVLLAGLKPNSDGRSIFFHETSCHQQGASQPGLFNTQPATSINMVQLTAREACAIESAAMHNPNLSVFVLFASPAYRNNGTSQPLLEAILSYANVHVRNLNLWTYAAGTPIYDWLKDGELFKSRYVLSHISDFLRYLTLWRWGGTYLDMDVIVMRSLEELPPNYTGAESNTHLAAGVMNFAPKGFGHEVAEQCLRDFRRNFNGYDWGNNGPGVITRVMQTVCGTKSIELMFDRKRCMGFQVFQRDAFYAIPWVEWEHFFEAQYLEDTLKRTQHSYVVHVWNKHSKHRRFKVGSKAAYGQFAKQHCPKVYASADEYF